MKNVGGQAVIEGVMMKAPSGWAVAVRDQKGEIHVKREKLAQFPKVLRLPVLRGFVTLFHTLFIGIKALEFSAQTAYDDEEEEKISKTSMSLTILASILLGIGLFILLPLYATKLLGFILPKISQSSFLFNITDGIIRVVIFLAYILGIGLWKEMARIFEYHGAEHKVIHAYEHGLELTVSNVKQYSPLHPRCGTSFLMIVMVLSILIFSMIPQEWTLAWKFASRVLLIPLIAGLSYEFLKFSAKFKDNPLMRFLIEPGLFLQRLTTREPDDSELEVAIFALKEVLDGETAND